ncbi:hypothetical protein Tco_0678757 [Tanacetum coccineum]|uniref:Uncharacterized protein n=1 Tax=Tanacetum coccineum TaxID=301880 RepID=A0ABQ4XGW7_9ASTR
MTITGARETVGSHVVQKPKRVKDYTYNKEKMLLCKQADKGVPLQAEQANCLEDTDEEIDEQELEARYSYMSKIQEVPTANSGTDTKPLEKTQNDSFKFVPELKQEMHADLKYVESLEKEIDELESDKEKFSNMYDLLLQECVSQDVMYLKAQLQDKNIAISELKKLIEKCKGKSVETKLDKPSVFRQSNAQRIQKPSVLGKPTPFSDSLERKSFSKTKSVPKTNVSDGLSKPVTTQILPQTARQAIVQLILFIVDSGCTKHMTGNLMLLCNFVEKYQGFITSKASIIIFSRLVNFVMRIWRLIFGNLLVLLEIFREMIYSLVIVDLISIQFVFKKPLHQPQSVSSLKHHQLKHGYGIEEFLILTSTINLLSNKDIVIGLPKLKYVKDQLCSSCEVSKEKRSSFKTKVVPSSKDG